MEERKNIFVINMPAFKSFTEPLLTLNVLQRLMALTVDDLFDPINHLVWILA